MGQKVNPIGFRMGYTTTWQSRWFAGSGKYRQYLAEDIKIRDVLMQKLRPAGVTKVEIERASNKVKVVIYVARPGILIGRGGTGLLELKKFLLKELKIKDEKTLEIAHGGQFATGSSSHIHSLVFKTMPSPARAADGDIILGTTTVFARREPEH